MRSINVRPGIATRDLLDTRLADAKHSSNSHTRYAYGTQAADFTNVVFSQLCVAMLLTFQGVFGMLLKCGTLLCGHVCHVVIMGSQEQMIGPNARMNITAVQYPKIIRDRAVVDQPRCAMRSHDMTLVRKLAVTIRRIGVFPKPACAGFVNLFPEAWFWVFHNTRVPAIGGVVTGRLAATFAALCDRIIHVGSVLRSYRPCLRLLAQRGGFVLPTL